MKKLLSIVLAVAVLSTMAFSMVGFQASAAEDINLLQNCGSNDESKATVTASGNGYVIEANTAFDSASNLAYGMAVEPAIKGFDMSTQGYVHMNITAEVPFRITLLDRSDAGDKWISFGNEFFNTIVTVGSEAGTEAPENGFFAAGTYNCVAYLGGVYSWKTNNGEAGWDIKNTNITAFYIELKDAGKVTVDMMKLSDKAEYDGTVAGGTAGGDTNNNTTAANGATTTTAKKGGATTTTASNAKTGDTSNAVLFVVVAAVAAGVVTLSVVASKKAKSR